MGFLSKLSSLFSSDESKNSVEDIEPIVALPAYKAEDDNFVNGVKCVKRFQACCHDEGVTKSCLESEWTYSQTGYLKTFTSYTSRGNVFEHYVFEYNEQNNLTKVYINDILKTERLYDASGHNNTEDISYNDDGSIEMRWVGTYDAENHLVSAVTYIFDEGYGSVGRIQSRAQSSYDKAGNLICSSLSYDHDPTLNSRLEMKYDDKGRQTEVVEFGSNEELVRKSAFVRNEQGKDILETQTDANGNLIEKYESEYDSKGNLVSWKRYSGDGEILISSSSSYKYDDKGNYTEQVIFENGVFDSAFIHEVEYY